MSEEKPNFAALNKKMKNMNYKLLKHSIRNTNLSDAAFRLLVTLIENFYYKVGQPLGIGIDYIVQITGKSADSLNGLINELKLKGYITEFTYTQNNRLTISFNDNIEQVVTPKFNLDSSSEEDTTRYVSDNEEFNLMWEECCKIAHLRD